MTDTPLNVSSGNAEREAGEDCPPVNQGETNEFSGASVTSAPRILVLGYGNPGRQDDGLGPALAAEIERMNLSGVTTCDNYQLVIEDSVDVAANDIVWFVDASLNGAEPYEVYEITPADEIAFSSHTVKPEVILALAETYYGKRPIAYLMGIRGYEFAFAEGLTDRAAENLRHAVAHTAEAIRTSIPPMAGAAE
ncbi:MAG: hydrogenase maturation protease [Alphaproteobacteria bacterium]